MNATSLLSKASFALLLLIFGCLVYIIVRDHRLEQMREAARRPQGQNETAMPRSTTPATAEQPLKRDEYAPLRPRAVAFAPTNPAPAQRKSPLPEPNRAATIADQTAAPFVPAANPPRVDYAGFAGSAPVAAAPPSVGFTISGQAFLRGTPPPEKQITLDPTCGRLHSKSLMTRHYIVGETGGLANVFVYIKSGAVSVGPPIAQTVLLDQVGCEFQPYVLGVQVQQTLHVRNSDPLVHNVHITPTQNRERNVTQRTKGSRFPFVFERPEVLVRFKCDIHPWMFAYVGVVDHPWFAVTDKNGKFTLPAGLTTGRYTLAAAHPKSGELVQDLTITSSGADPVTFVFEASDTLATR